MKESNRTEVVHFLLSMLSGVLLALAMPRPGIWAFSWIGLVPLIIAMRRVRPPQAALYGFVTGAVYFGIVIFWISIFGYLPLAVVVALEAAFFAVFAWVGCRLLPSRIGWWGYAAFPAAWIAMQWARSLGTYSFTWASFAHTQANVLPVIQIASITGPWGIDFLVCLFNLALADFASDRGAAEAYRYPRMTRAKRLLPAAIALASAAVLWVGGIVLLELAPTYHPHTRVAVIQGNVRQDVVPGGDYLRDTFEVYQSLSREAALAKSEFIVWPESALPVVITEAGWGARLREVAREARANLMVGGYDASDDPSVPLSFNAAHVYSPTGRKLDVYHKVHLVPGGEFVPLRDRLPFLSRYRVREEDVLPGKSYRLVETDLGKIGVNICFESIFPQISRLETRNGAEALFVITYDAWFERTQAARQHFMMSRLRAVENGRYVVRGAATGISGIIDPQGRVMTDLDIFRRGIVSGEIEPLRAKTLYTRLGDYFAYACTGLVLVFTLTLSRQGRGQG